MESAAIAVAAIAVVATALLKLLATAATVAAEPRSEDVEINRQLTNEIAARYPPKPGAPLDDGLPGGAAVVPWGDGATDTITEAAAAAADSVAAFLKISDDLCAIAPRAAETLNSTSRAVGIASVVAAAAPLLYPGRDADNVYAEWYWQLVLVYYEPSATAPLGPPPRVDVELMAPLKRVVYAAAARR